MSTLQKWVLFIMLIVLCVGVGVFYFKSKLGLDASSVFWFYSTLAQVFAAMLALVGLFVVYKLEEQSRDIDITCQNAMNRLSLSPISETMEGTLEAIRDDKKNLDPKKNKGRWDSCVLHEDSIEVVAAIKERIKKEFMTPLLLMTTFLILALIMLFIHSFFLRITCNHRKNEHRYNCNRQN